MRHLIDIILAESRYNYTQDSIAKQFIDPELYKKVGTAEARLAMVGETIATVIDGKIETTKTAHEDDVVVKGPKGEEYIIDRPKFQGRYGGPELSIDYQVYQATGTTYAVEWTHGPARFKTSWGEMMIINDGDWLCSISKEPDGDLYRIDADAFAATYEKIEDDEDAR